MNKKLDDKLKEEYLKLMEKWATFKRNGSAPVPPEYERDRKAMRRIAIKRDALRASK